MKSRVVFLGIVLLAGVATWWSMRQSADAPVSPRALLDFVAGAEREATRLPARITRLTDAEEIAIGDELARSHLALDDPTSVEIQAYVEHVGMMVSARAQRKLPWRFHYIADRNFVNAYALPGGHVFIGAGLIAMMDSEDELASVLGHEVEHVDRRHCAERLQVEAHLRKVHLGMLAEIAMLPIEIFQAGYSKEEEFQADAEGTRLTVAAGYSPRGAISLFEKFQALQGKTDQPARSPRGELSQVARETLQQYFQTHPPESERIRRIQNMIAAERWEALTTERVLQITVAKSEAVGK